MRPYERNGVLIDQCEECRGIFLDRGELERLIDAERYAEHEREPREREHHEDDGRHDDDRYERERHERHGKRRTGPVSFLQDFLGGGE